jgi:uncharacterized sulfatase
MGAPRQPINAKTDQPKENEKMKIHLCLALLIGSLASAADRPPNVILVFIDDMGWADFSCFGNDETKTEAIDKLAAEGLCFEQFYVNSPICSPSRVAITTGQYPQRWKIGSYLAHRKLNEQRGMANWLDPKAPTLARSLQQAGYATAHFGKWHMGGQRDVGDAPLIREYGFDASLTNFEGLGARLLPLVRTPQKPQRRKIWQDSEKLGRGEVTWTDRCKITGGFADAAVDFIAQAEKANKPFYINVWPDDVHGPFFPSLENWGDGKRRTLYLSVLKEMDQQLARVFDRVNSSENLRDNTLILVCSDNGHDLGAGSAGPLRGSKTTLYEGGIRSPLVVWGPGLIKQEQWGSRNKTSVFSAIDLVPSLLQLTGVTSDMDYDGNIVTETLLGQSDHSREQPIFYRRPPDRKSFYGQTYPDLAIRHGKWKLLCEYDGSQPQLYNIPADHGESKNLAEAHPETVQKLAKKLLAWHRAMPADNGATFKLTKPSKKNRKK